MSDLTPSSNSKRWLITLSGAPRSVSAVRAGADLALAARTDLIAPSRAGLTAPSRATISHCPRSTVAWQCHFCQNLMHVTVVGGSQPMGPQPWGSCTCDACCWAMRGPQMHVWVPLHKATSWLCHAARRPICLLHHGGLWVGWRSTWPVSMLICHAAHLLGHRPQGRLFGLAGPPPPINCAFQVGWRFVWLVI